MNPDFKRALLGLMCLLSASLWAGPVVLLQGDKVSLQADGVPVREVLREFQRHGVRVRLDPGAQALVSGRFENRTVEKVLEEVLDPLSFVLRWDYWPGLDEPILHLQEIQVFRNGQQDAATALSSEDYRLVTLPDGREAVAGELLVGLRSGVSRTEFLRLVQRVGGSVGGCVEGVNAYLVVLPTGANLMERLAQLKRSDLVVAAEPNYVVKIPSGTEAALSKLPDWTVPDETQPAIAVLDSGLQAGLDVEGLLRASYDAVNPGSELDDTLGHGTRMALLASGLAAPDGQQVSGKVSPLIAVRAFDDNGVASSFGLMEAMRFAVENGASVINLSWGSGEPSDFLAGAVQQAEASDVVVVAAAGNEPTGLPVYPAAYSTVVAVAADNADGTPWAQSNYGDFVDTRETGFVTFDSSLVPGGGSYAGTSVSSAVVAAKVAAWRAAHPEATAAETRATLFE